MSRAAAIATVLVATSVATAQPDDARWTTRVGFANDVLTDVTPPIDDSGFTHDMRLSVRRRYDATTFGGALLHRWITSTADRRRWDQFDLVALVERAWPYRITTEARLGPTFAGNFGGRWMQNGWHELTETAPTIDEGLQNDYDGTRRIGVLAGARATAAVGDRVEGYTFVDGQVAVGGTGVAWVEGALGGRASSRHVGAHVELAVTRYHVADANLALPGAYAPGWQLAWRVGVHVRWSRFELVYEYRANEGGSGEPIGVLELVARR